MVWSLFGKLALTCMGRRWQEHASTLHEPGSPWHLGFESGGPWWLGVHCIDILLFAFHRGELGGHGITY